MVNKKKVKKEVVKSHVQVKKDFEIFAKGVERLKELELELERLDTRGFAKEEVVIRSRLKNVSDIPFIEKKVADLRLKINNKYRPKRKKKSKVSKDIEGLKQQIPLIKRGISKLSDKIEDISKRKGDVDSEVGMLVDGDFNDLLGDIKIKLSERVKRKEKNVEGVLKTDLILREKRFNEKHKNLIRSFKDQKKKLEKDFERKYATKVKLGLEKDISDKFNYAVIKKIDSEKSRIGKQYKKLLKQHAEQELERRKNDLMKKLRKEYVSELRKLEKKRKKQEFLEQKERERLNLIKETSEKERKELIKLNKEKLLMKKKRNSLLKLKRSEEFKLKKAERDLEKAKQDFELEKKMVVEGIKQKLFEKYRDHYNEKKNKLEEIERELRKKLKSENQSVVNVLMKEKLLTQNRRNSLLKLKRSEEFKLKKAEMDLEKAKQDFELEKKMVASDIKNKLVEKYKRDYSQKKERLLEIEKELRKKLKSENQGVLGAVLSKLKLRESLFERKKQRELNKIDSDKNLIRDSRLEYLREREETELKLKTEQERLGKLKEKYKLENDEVKHKIRLKLAEEFHADLEKELLKREELMRDQLKSEFEFSLKKKMQEREAELKRKKLDLEFELQSKMKSVLNG